MNYLKPRAQPRAMPSSLDPSAPSNAAPRRPPKQARISFAGTDTIAEASEDQGEGSTPGGEPLTSISAGLSGPHASTAADKESRRRSRASGRSATIAFKSEVDARLAAEAEERVRCHPHLPAVVQTVADLRRVSQLKMPSRYKPPPPKARYTQDELIEEALYTEEMNNESLQDWLEKEEARRLALRVVRKKIDGPVVTWISRDSQRKPLIEEVVQEDAADGAEEGVEGQPKGTEAATPLANRSPSKAHKNAVAGPSRTAVSAKALLTSADQDVEERHARNLVLLNPAPTSWSTEMHVLFGSHVNWSTMRVVPARNRPQSQSFQLSSVLRHVPARI